MTPAALMLALIATAAPDNVGAAIARADQCQFQEALSLIDKAEAFQKESVPGRLLRARLLIQLERGDEALRELDVLPAKSQFYSEGEHHLLRALAAATAGKLDLAKTELSQARRAGADPDLVDGALGKVLIQAGQLDQAELLLRRVLSRKGAETMTGAVVNLAVAAARRGRDFEAAGLLRLAWHLGYRNPRKIKAEKPFDRIVASGVLLEDLVADEQDAHCTTW